MEKRQLLFLVVCAVALLALFSTTGAQASADTPVPADAATTAPEGDEPAPTATGILEEVIAPRTPEPTATPGAVQEQVETLVARAGLARATFLGLSVTDWLLLLGSVLIIVVGYAIGTWLVRHLLPRVVKRTPTEFDDRSLEAIGGDVRWMVVLLMLHLATIRLAFVSAGIKALLQDAYFFAGVALGARIIWKLIDLADEWARERAIEEGRESQLEPVIVLLSRVGRVLVVILGVTILLSYFGVNVTAFAAALGLGGLAFSLAARDTIADAIAGFIILVDQPFRIGDRIEIQGVGTWGDVVDIGLRTTRIRTRDNRLVIVPNSVISVNQVINYTVPDPQYRIETHIGVDYNTDVEAARQVMVDAVRQVEGVLPDKPVEALYVENGDSAMIFRVRWWIGSYQDTRRMFDRVHTVLKYALDEAEIESPFPTQTLNVQIEPQQTAEGIPRAP